MRPSNDASGHGGLLWSNFGRFPLRFTTAEAGLTIQVPRSDKPLSQEGESGGFAFRPAYGLDIPNVGWGNRSLYDRNL
jgi:hypothetical protein